ncbi:MAG: hypothetical protein ACRD6N_15355 [Pyrinomonadaceae bacterium]
MSKRSFLTANGVVKIVAVRFFAWGALSFLEDEVQLGGTTKLNLDDEWLAAISKSAAKVHARKYQEAVEEIEDFLIGKRLNSLYEPRQVLTNLALPIKRTLSTTSKPLRIRHRASMPLRPGNFKKCSATTRMSYFCNRRPPCSIILRITYEWRNTTLKENLTFGLMVKSYDEAIDFYTKKLGFVVAEECSHG